MTDLQPRPMGRRIAEIAGWAGAIGLVWAMLTVAVLDLVAGWWRR